MNELSLDIFVNELTTGSGNKTCLLFARDFYIKLDLELSNWKRWYEMNIIENEYFRENVDWIYREQTDSGKGRPTKDFIITIRMAKHLALQAKTEKAHLYRNYLINFEDNFRDTQIGQLLNTIEVMENKIKSFEALFDAMSSKIQRLESKTNNQLAIAKQQQVLIEHQETYIEKLVKKLESIRDEREQVKVFHRAMLENKGFSSEEIISYNLKPYIYKYSRLCYSDSDFHTINRRIRNRNLSAVPEEPNLIEPIY